MSETSSSDGSENWVQWFCGLPGHEMFCEVDRSYIEDGFNLYGLRLFVHNINDCLDIILDRLSPDESSEQQLQSVNTLYGMIHARYITTTSGLDAMYQKYSVNEFGTCPRLMCNGQSVVPAGVRDEPKCDGVKLYCPRCQDLYNYRAPPAAHLDGAYFGTTFPHLFFMTFEHLVTNLVRESHVPRIFGFRIHSSSRSTPTNSSGRRRQLQDGGSGGNGGGGCTTGSRETGSGGRHGEREGGAAAAGGGSGGSVATAAAATGGGGGGGSVVRRTRDRESQRERERDREREKDRSRDRSGDGSGSNGNAGPVSARRGTRRSAAAAAEEAADGGPVTGNGGSKAAIAPMDVELGNGARELPSAKRHRSSTSK